MLEGGGFMDWVDDVFAPEALSDCMLRGWIDADSSALDTCFDPTADSSLCGPDQGDPAAERVVSLKSGGPVVWNEFHLVLEDAR